MLGWRMKNCRLISNFLSCFWKYNPPLKFLLPLIFIGVSIWIPNKVLAISSEYVLRLPFIGGPFTITHTSGGTHTGKSAEALDFDLINPDNHEVISAAIGKVIWARSDSG